MPISYYYSNKLLFLYISLAKKVKGRHLLQDNTD